MLSHFKIQCLEMYIGILFDITDAPASIDVDKRNGCDSILGICGSMITMSAPSPNTAYTAHFVHPNIGYAETSYMLETSGCVKSQKVSLRVAKSGRKR